MTLVLVYQMLLNRCDNLEPSLGAASSLMSTMEYFLTTSLVASDER